MNWLKVCWMRFLRTKPHYMFYKTSMNEGALFKTVNRLFQIRNVAKRRRKSWNFEKQDYIVISALS